MTDAAAADSTAPAGLAIRYRPLKALVPYARNARTHPRKQLDKIKASLVEFGWANPILTADDGVIAGHGRREAALELAAEGKAIPGNPDPDRAPTVDLSHLSPAQRKAYVLMDNRSALDSGWDDELLSTELGELSEDGFDLSLTGFDAEDLDRLLGTDPAAPGETDPDEIPSAPRHPVSRPGDVWVCGRHLITCGDSTHQEVADRIGAMEAQVIVSDPPYGIGYSYESHDDGDNEANARLVSDAFALGPDVLIWTPGLPNLARDVSRFGPAKVLVWHKKFAAAGNGLGGASTWEPILVVGKPPERALKNDVIQIMTERVEVEGVSLRKLHTCPKPVALYALLIEAFTAKDGTVHEPFSGSGTTLMACETTGRSCRASEYEPKYVDVAVRRWELHTGQEAVLRDDGRTFAQVAAARPVVEAGPEDDVAPGAGEHGTPDDFAAAGLVFDDAELSLEDLA